MLARFAANDPAPGSAAYYVKLMEGVVNTGVKGYSDVQRVNLANEIMRKGGTGLTPTEISFLQAAQYQQQQDAQKMWMYVVGGVGLVAALGAIVYWMRK